MDKIDFPFEVKAAGDKGRFEGYAAVFDNVDLGYDVIEKGAFQKVKTTRDGKVRIAKDHDLRQLMGVSDFSQDDHGLHVKGTLNLAVSYVRDAYELMKQGALDGLSVGFNILPGGAEWIEDKGIRVIKAAELWEYSLVPFGMNPEALVDSVKEADKILDIRTFERFLVKNGYSRREAVAIASHGFKGLQRDSAAGGQSDSDTEGEVSLSDIKQVIADTKFY